MSQAQNEKHFFAEITKPNHKPCIFGIVKIWKLTFLPSFSQVASLAKVTKICRSQNVVNQVVLLHLALNKKKIM